MVRIALLTSVGRTIDAFFPGIIEQWRDHGHDVVCAAATPSAIKDSTVLTALSRRPSPRNLRASGQIGTWLTATEADVLVTNTAVASFFARTRDMPCPVVYFCHGLHWNVGKAPAERVWQILERYALRYTDGVVVINDDDDEWFSMYAEAIPRLRLPSGVGLDLSKYRSVAPRVSNEGLRLLWAGEFSERKRPQLAVEVLAEIRRLGVEATLDMCGEGELVANTNAGARDLHVEDYVNFVGYASDIPRRIADSDALLMTSMWEGLPRIGLESIAVGRPVFAFDVKGTRSLPGVFLVPDADVAALAAQVLEKARSPIVARPRPQSLDERWVADELVTFLGAIA